VTPNWIAFLTMIAVSEGTQRYEDPYRVCYGGYIIKDPDLLDHPAITGEWRGMRITHGKFAGKLSDAAGRYQLIKPTWAMMKGALKLSDFNPASQDAAAVSLITRRGAAGLIEAGSIAEAINACRLEWASLPGNDYGQPQSKMGALLDHYRLAGGTLMADPTELKGDPA
jgi:lysozyme